MTQSSLLHVSELTWGEVKPRSAAIHVTLTASKLLSGRAALTKSEELRKLVTALLEQGLPEDAVALEGASLDVSTGLFTRSSSVTYRVRITVNDLERIASVLEAIADSKQATLTHITWDHIGGSGAEELLAAAAARAVSKARRLAASLGVSLGDVVEVHEDELGEEPAMPPMMMRSDYESAAGVVRACKRSIGNELAGLDLAPTKRLGVRVRVAYRLTSVSRAAP